MNREICHKSIRIELFDVPNPRFAPRMLENLLSSNHGWDTGGVGNGLGADFGVARLVVADVVNVDRLRFSIFGAGDDIADAGAAFGGLAEVAWIWQDRLKKLERDDFHALVNDRVDPRHADVLKHFEMLQVVV